MNPCGCSSKSCASRCHSVGAQTPFVSHHVRHRLGSGLSAAAGRPRRRFPQRPDRQLKNLGQDIMFTFPGRIPAVEGSTQSGRTYYFTYEDYLAIRTEARNRSKYLSPVLNREDIRAVSDYGSTNGQVFGVAPEYNQIRNVPVGPGRWFNDADNTETRRVAVVGWELLKNIFPGRPAVGRPSCSTASVSTCSAWSAKSGRMATTEPMPASSFRLNHAQPVPPERAEQRRRHLLSELSAAYAGLEIWRQNRKSTRFSPAATASIPSCEEPSRTGTPSKTINGSARLLRRYGFSWASWG